MAPIYSLEDAMVLSTCGICENMGLDRVMASPSRSRLFVTPQVVDLSSALQHSRTANILFGTQAVFLDHRALVESLIDFFCSASQDNLRLWNVGLEEPDNNMAKSRPSQSAPFKIIAGHHGLISQIRTCCII